ncbi:hypothetical protein LXA43DRAFT_26435 [Ganoderma leucocontextum]|nr:hypothetical protein LXA43DRAFT_26435 [Ganoderma leucocontextum]
MQVAPPRKVLKRDAYKAFSSPDSSWSTIPPEKKRKQTGNDGNKHVTTTNFRLRLQLGRATNQPGKGREDAEAEAADPKSRIVTYLPPPRGRESGHEARPLPRNNSRSVASPQEHDPDSPPAFHPMAIRRAAPPHMPLPAYRAPNPVPHAPSGRHDSERPSPYREAAAYDAGGDTIITFDQSGLPQRYSSLRRGVAKRKRLLAELWDIMGLPSCGVIFRDEWRGRRCQSGMLGTRDEAAGGPDASKHEMRIISWPASREATRSVSRR